MSIPDAVSHYPASTLFRRWSCQAEGMKGKVRKGRLLLLADAKGKWDYVKPLNRVPFGCPTPCSYITHTLHLAIPASTQPGLGCECRLLPPPADGCCSQQPPWVALRGCHHTFWGHHALYGPEESAGQSKGAALEPPACPAVCGHAGGLRGAGGVCGRVSPLLRVPGGQGPAARGGQSRAHHR